MATSSQALKGQIEENLLKCPICCSQFVNPHVLNCQHTFCYRCLKSYAKNHLGPRNTINCVLCNQSTRLSSEGISSLAKNLTVSNLIKVMKKEKKSETPAASSGKEMNNNAKKQPPNGKSKSTTTKDSSRGSKTSKLEATNKAGGSKIRAASRGRVANSDDESKKPSKQRSRSTITAKASSEAESKNRENSSSCDSSNESGSNDELLPQGMEKGGDAKSKDDCSGKEPSSGPPQVRSGRGHYPSNWDCTHPRQLVTITAQSHPIEYQNTLNKFTTAGLPLASVVQLQRVENKRQFTQFIAQKLDAAERMNGTEVTRELFHGTSSDICDQIFKGGFDRSYAGKNATAYGDGVYFATSSGYSHSFTRPNLQGHRKMFLADVITGNFSRGASGMKVPPLLPGSNDSYDSLVDDLYFPSMYIVFKDASVNPLYILTYV